MDRAGVAALGHRPSRYMGWWVPCGVEMKEEQTQLGWRGTYQAIGLARVLGASTQSLHPHGEPIPAEGHLLVPGVAWSGCLPPTTTSNKAKLDGQVLSGSPRGQPAPARGVGAPHPHTPALLIPMQALRLPWGRLLAHDSTFIAWVFDANLTEQRGLGA